MELQHLRIFLSVFRNRSFSKASVQLHLSQPTISDHIKTLETGLRCRLFDRLGRKIIPTPEAETLYNHALEIVEKAGSLRNILGLMKNDISGELVIAASTIPGAPLGPQNRRPGEWRSVGVTGSIPAPSPYFKSIHRRCCEEPGHGAAPAGQLEITVLAPDEPDIVGALGAALHAV